MQEICKCSHHNFMPFLVVLFGVTFSMGYWGIIGWDIVSVMWPVIVILLGLSLLVDKLGMCKCASSGSCCCC